MRSAAFCLRPFFAALVLLAAGAQAAWPGTGCAADTPAARAALQAVAEELKAQGMAFSAACGAATGAWTVQVRVVDGLRASKVVRGPLADGESVDMGTPPGVALAGAARGADGFSPDVRHNREWLRGVMARHQFDNLPGAWWHYARRDAARQTVAVR
ncbi:MAG: M15 family metallopeptidase [Acidovorax sp.]|uniref:D-Ala-D-Ala dipeptidase n=1 Tax=Acidovorax sp. TaxID=1872122 RepID=UPI0039E3C99F